MRRRVLILLVLAAVAAGGVAVWRRGHGGERWYTGFVEGEERVLRERGLRPRARGRLRRGRPRAGGRGRRAPRRGRHRRARAASKRQEIGVLDAQIRRSEEQVALAERTWTHDVAARARGGGARRRPRRELAASDYERAARPRASSDVASLQTPRRARSEPRRRRGERRSTQQRELLAAPRRDGGRDRASRSASSRCCGSSSTLSRAPARRARGRAREVRRSARPRRRPSCRRSSLWPGELAQPGTPLLSVLDPRDKYVQIYVPVGRPRTACASGRRVAIELDSEPGQRVPGEVGFVADQANFTPEKIETRSDRLGAGLPREGADPRGRRALPARHRGQRVPARRRRGAQPPSSGGRVPQCGERSGERALPLAVRLRSSGSASASGARSRASTSRSTARSWSAWSGPTARARRRCCARSPGCSKSRPRRRTCSAATCAATCAR